MEKKLTIEAKETYDGLATGGDSGSLKELALAGLEAVSDCFSPSSFRYEKKLAPTSALAKKIKKRLPNTIELHSLKLQETKTSFAEWFASDN